MIRRPKRVNVRFSDAEFEELENLIKISRAWDMTTLVRRALAHYRRRLYEEQEQLEKNGHALAITSTNLLAPIETKAKGGKQCKATAR